MRSTSLTPLSSQHTVLAFVLAGGRGTRLNPLTEERSKPAVPFGGRYRIIDFVLSNLINSGIYSTYVMTQYMSQSLNEHLNDAWNFGSALKDVFVSSVPAQQRTDGSWYKGTADAVYQNFNLISDHDPDIMLVFGGDHIFLMDVRQLIQFGLNKRADVTIACNTVPISEASRFGVIEVDDEWRITGFQEKPEKPTPLPNNPDMALISMGNYSFDTDVLKEYLEADADIEDSSHDFGKNILPTMLADGKKLFAYDFNQNTIPGSSVSSSYWRDVGTMESYYEAAMDLRSIQPELDIYNAQWPIRSELVNLPPAKFVHNISPRMGQAHQSIIAEGTIVSGGTVVNSVVGRNCRINSYAHVEDCVIMDDVTIGRHAQIRNCIIDKHCVIPENDVIGFNHEQDAQRFHISDCGLVVIAKSTKVTPV